LYSAILGAENAAAIGNLSNAHSTSVCHLFILCEEDKISVGREVPNGEKL